MTRRTLFGLLAAAATDPERLVWQPGKKLVSIPKPRPFWSPGEFVTFGDGRLYEVIRCAEQLSDLVVAEMYTPPYAALLSRPILRLNKHGELVPGPPAEVRVHRISHDLETRVTVGRGYWRNLNP